MKKVIIIKNCPSCDSLLDRVVGQLFCRNDSCEAKSSKKLVHFSKTMKIKGLGEKTIEKLALERISDIYNLSEEDIIDCIGEKLGLKLYYEIVKSKTQKIDVYLSSFGISLIGATASSKIAKLTNNINEITPELCKKAGLGEKATANLCNWLAENKALLSEIPIEFEEVQSNSIVSKDITVCITGKLIGHTRATAEALLNNNGITCVSGVSNKIDYLICNDENSSSSKAVKARSLNKPIMSFEKLLIKENIINE
jgi:DNA ligase (NAD+)